MNCVAVAFCDPGSGATLTVASDSRASSCEDGMGAAAGVSAVFRADAADGVAFDPCASGAA